MADAKLMPVWRRNDPSVVEDAFAFWDKLNALPKGADAAARAKELCVAAYEADELVGVSTISLTELAAVRARLGFFRCLVGPEHRRGGLARSLAVFSRQVLSEWSQANPAERVSGMAAIIESRNLDALSRQPVWPASGLALVGYTPDGRQLRISWFEHAQL